ncbi:lysosomal protective protein-like [Amphiura filiformis]|uniref:lysosomal protective protein-like n=1 Tax=Amphiura filiformis TaxID=82378 RepID=UPI003B227BFB
MQSSATNCVIKMKGLHLLGLSCLILVLSICGVLSQPAEDEVTYLPGLSKQPTFQHYSGYLKATGTRYLHYWYVESQSAPDKDPLVVWMNGGPGCSSLDGLMEELGPFKITDEATVIDNPYSWNLVANIIFLEAPAGVGYSYADDMDYTTGDKQVAVDNYQALQSFFAKFPNRKSNPFYIFGESYAGIYVPTLSVLVMEGQAGFPINFKGFGVGNGFHDRPINTNTMITYAYYHGILGDDLWNLLQKYCCDSGTCNFYNNTNGVCAENIFRAQHLITDIGLNYYSLYDDCYGGARPSIDRYLVDMKTFLSIPDEQFPTKADFIKKLKSSKKNTSFSKPVIHKHGVTLGESVQCLNATAVTAYLQRADVRKALHIKESLPPWEVCR